MQEMLSKVYSLKNMSDNKIDKLSLFLENFTFAKSLLSEAEVLI